MVIIVIIDNGFLVGITRGCRQRVCHTTLNFVVSGATYPILFYFIFTCFPKKIGIKAIGSSSLDSIVFICTCSLIQ